MDTIDTYLGKKLKSAVAHMQPPINVRSRLLTAAGGIASATRREGLPSMSQRRHMERRNRNNEWPAHLMEWALIDAFNAGAVHMRVVL